MSGGEKTLNSKKSYSRDFYIEAYLSTMKEVIYKPRLLLNDLTNPVFAFLLKFLHPKLLLNWEGKIATCEFTTFVTSAGYQMKMILASF